MKTVHAVIVNYRRPELTLRAVASVLASEGIEPRVVVIDNAGDGQFARAEYGVDRRVAVIANAENRGFGAACNQGIEQALEAGSDFIFLLNNDATVRADTLARLAGPAAAHGLAAPKIVRPDGTLYSAGGIVELWRARCRNRGRHEADDGRYGAGEIVRFNSASALMIDRRALAGGIRFHEPYFLYYEDADLCLALERAGWRVAYVPEAVAEHLESASTAAAGPERLDYYDARNRVLLLARQATPMQRMAGTIYLKPALRVKMARLRRAGEPARADAIARGLADAGSGKFGPGFGE